MINASLQAFIQRTGSSVVAGGRWERFGRYNCYALVDRDGIPHLVPAHAGELVPGGTEDLWPVLRRFAQGILTAPLTLELDPTYRCASIDCGGACFSAPYRSERPSATISEADMRSVMEDFAAAGGKIVRFDGGGDPLMHRSVRDGSLPELAATLGLRHTILTSGDLLPQSSWRRIVDSGCYLRVSLNAASQRVRSLIHGNRLDFERIWETLASVAARGASLSEPVPVGATFLLHPDNYREVVAAAVKAREIGISHFSVRRILGPASMRQWREPSAIEAVDAMLDEVAALSDDRFVTFVPERHLMEPDLSPRVGEIEAAQCWQSTFKTIVEPGAAAGEVAVQLCGRYRGGGTGQAMQLPPVAKDASPSEWVGEWLRSFDRYPVSRPALVSHCESCIDRGFIQMVDRLLSVIPRLSDDAAPIHLHVPGGATPGPILDDGWND